MPVWFRFDWGEKRGVGRFKLDDLSSITNWWALGFPLTLVLQYRKQELICWEFMGEQGCRRDSWQDMPTGK